jgi:uncharacterized phage protein gp47/JayE
MAYIPPTVGSGGLIVPLYPDILANLINQFLGIYGPTSYLQPDSADYQDIAVRALQYSDVNQALQQVWLSMSPQYATGPSLDQLGSLIGTARRPSSNSTVGVVISGTPGTVIANGIVQDTTGNYWTLPPSITIGGGTGTGGQGSVATTAVALVLGNITANPGTVTIIVTPTLGWVSVTNPLAAAAGNAVETDSEYRGRLLTAQAIPSSTLLAGTAAAIAQLDGVTRSQVYENYTNSTDANGLPPHSISAVVDGPTYQPQDVGQAIYNNKGIGCATYGTTAITVQPPPNTNGGIPQIINYIAAIHLNIYVAFQINARPANGYTTATSNNIIAAVNAYIESLGIGEPVVLSELISAATSVITDRTRPEFAIRLVTYGGESETANATSSGASTIITVSPSPGQPPALEIAVGQIVTGAGIPGPDTGAPATTVAAWDGVNTVTLSQATTKAINEEVHFFTTGSGTVDVTVLFYEAAVPFLTTVTLVS